MKGMLRGAMVLVLALGVLACVQQLWRVTYTVAGNNKTVPDKLAIGSDGRILVVGRAGFERTLEDVFVAAFDVNGVLMWESVLPEEPGIYSELLALDGENNSYIARVGGQPKHTTIYKFDPMGNLLNSWVVGDAARGYAEDLKIGPDNNVYLSAGGGQLIYAFAPEGDELWRYQSQENALPQGSRASLGFLPNGHIVHASEDVLTIVSAAGEMLFQRTAKSVGLSEFASMVVANDEVVVVGNATAGAGEGELIKFNDELASVENVQLEFEVDSVQIGSNGPETCAVLGDWEVDFFGGSISLDYKYFYYNSDTGEFQTIESPAVFVMDVSSANHACYVGGVTGGGTPYRERSHFYRYDFMAQTSTKFSIPNSALVDFKVVGKDIIQVGNTGELEAERVETFVSRHRWK